MGLARNARAVRVLGCLDFCPHHFYLFVELGYGSPQFSHALLTSTRYHRIFFLLVFISMLDLPLSLIFHLFATAPFITLARIVIALPFLPFPDDTLQLLNLLQIVLADLQ
jgi:hypothetical protein